MLSGCELVEDTSVSWIVDIFSVSEEEQLARERNRKIVVEMKSIFRHLNFTDHTSPIIDNESQLTINIGLLPKYIRYT